jgi:hypothetical protein
VVLFVFAPGCQETWNIDHLMGRVEPEPFEKNIDQKKTVGTANYRQHHFV